ncbi:MAG: nitroreductase family protein [Deltaproteobacteria bacterium]|nr:nitroreductase family protein [Deltaproteobacteria bacterium]
MFKDLVYRNRSYRRFYEGETVSMQALRKLVDLARHSAAAANLQPLKYLLSCEPEQNARIFPHLAWAGYLKEWKGPAPGERPAAYIVILGDTNIVKDFGCDHGIAAQTILLGAVEKGLGGCMIGSIRREKLRASLEIPDRYKILLVLAIGRPKEKVVIEEVGADGNIRYWRDETDVHHVPKRPLDQIIL